MALRRYQPERAVSFVWGEDDPFGGPTIAREFVRPFPNARLDIVPDSGHAVWMDDPAYAAEATARFLTD